MKTLNLIVKADVQGSAEAVKSSLEKISNDEVRVRVIHSAVGAISESDVMLAATSDAIIVGFNVRPDNAARDSATCYCTDGKIQRGCDVRVLRDNIVIHEGSLASLRRFKDDVREVAAGYECGMQIEKFNDIKVGDVIECFVMEEIKA